LTRAARLPSAAGSVDDIRVPDSSIYDRVLLLGGEGMLAQALRRSLMRRGHEVTGIDLAQCDITDAGQVDRFFDKFGPTLVLNAAAYTAVDKAEQQEDLATRVNGDAVGHLARAADRHGAVLVHYSTDFVFDGTATVPYAVDAVPNPVSAYGRSKLAGERALIESGHARFLILRTAWLYGPWAGRPFPKVILDAAKAGKPLTVVSDQHGSPTLTINLAEATLDLIEADANGTFHVTGGGMTTWFDFARETLDAFGVEPIEFHPISAADWAKMRPDAASRPAYSVLDVSKTEQVLRRPMRPWQAALLDYRDLTAGDA
jgi:dTDP-4-dehydrorhamnose reductase